MNFAAYDCLFYFSAHWNKSRISLGIRGILPFISMISFLCKIHAISFISSALFQFFSRNNKHVHEWLCSKSFCTKFLPVESGLSSLRILPHLARLSVIPVPKDYLETWGLINIKPNEHREFCISKLLKVLKIRTWSWRLKKTPHFTTIQTKRASFVVSVSRKTLWPKHLNSELYSAIVRFGSRLQRILPSNLW